jgi:predicted MPP superfamily phosphohydrolase
MNRLQKCDPDSALKTEQTVDYKILLTHQPNAIKLLKKEKANLVLSGHTHAGQFFPANLLIYFFQKYVKGLYLIKDTYLYVNQGTGYWGPANRLGTSMEISEIVLVKNV